MMGNKETFENLVLRFTYFIKAHVQKFNPQKNGIDPEDIIQDVQIKLWKVLKGEKSIYNHSSYIKKVIDSTVIDHLRRSRRFEGIINNEKKYQISDQKQIYNMKENELSKKKESLNIALNSLIESRQKVLRFFLLNMSIEEISIVLNWSQDKTRNLIYRGLSDLKKKLKEKGISYED